MPSKKGVVAEVEAVLLAILEILIVVALVEEQQERILVTKQRK